MSIDINWTTLTAGPDGSARAEKIRAFIHDKFQQVTLPRFIRSVKVHSFDFGSVPPDIEIKDICDPLPDFYEEDEDDDSAEDEPAGHDLADAAWAEKERRARDNGRASSNVEENAPTYSRLPPFANARAPGLRTTLTPGEQLGNTLLPRVSTPGIPGGTSNITNYFHLPLGAGLSGSTTPLAAVAGAQFQGWPDYTQHGRPSTPNDIRLRHAASFSSLTMTPPSAADPGSRPSSQHRHDTVRRNSLAESTGSSSQGDFRRTPSPSPPIRLREKSPEDLQVVSHVHYVGDIKLSLTAEILLDYPMPSFVGIPLKLNITGLTFDGVALLAYIKKRVHFCFLSPEDADTFVGGETSLEPPHLASQTAEEQSTRRPRIGGLLEHIKVESEIGQKENGKQVLKNVGKVETFILEQVRRIFEDEFIYPSFWTFLV
jgi:distribution and morphology protein 12